MTSATLRLRNMTTVTPPKCPRRGGPSVSAWPMASVRVRRQPHSQRQARRLSRLPRLRCGRPLAAAWRVHERQGQSGQGLDARWLLRLSPPPPPHSLPPSFPFRGRGAQTSLIIAVCNPCAARHVPTCVCSNRALPTPQSAAPFAQQILPGRPSRLPSVTPIWGSLHPPRAVSPEIGGEPRTKPSRPARPLLARQ